MRSILINWLIEVAEEYSLSQQTLFLTVNLVDRFLAKENVSTLFLQLLGVTCMLLASYEVSRDPNSNGQLLVPSRFFFYFLLLCYYPSI